MELTLSPGAGAVKTARDAVAQISGLPEDVRDDVRLLVSELVTNSVRHASLGPFGRIHVRAYVEGDRLRVEVDDSGTGFAMRPRVLSADQTSGWGLYLVDQLASRWGASRVHGSHVWFELDLPETAAQSV